MTSASKSPEPVPLESIILFHLICAVLTLSQTRGPNYLLIASVVIRIDALSLPQVLIIKKFHQGFGTTITTFPPDELSRVMINSFPDPNMVFFFR